MEVLDFLVDERCTKNLERKEGLGDFLEGKHMGEKKASVDTVSMQYQPKIL